MNRIDNLTDDADQVTNLTLEDGTVAILELHYRGATQRWTYDVTHPSFPAGAVKGQMLCAYPNILRQFKNVVPFGISCVSTDGLDPISAEDFVDGRVSLYLLDAADVEAVERSLFGAPA